MLWLAQIGAILNYWLFQLLTIVFLECLYSGSYETPYSSVYWFVCLQIFSAWELLTPSILRSSRSCSSISRNPCWTAKRSLRNSDTQTHTHTPDLPFPHDAPRRKLEGSFIIVLPVPQAMAPVLEQDLLLDWEDDSGKALAPDTLFCYHHHLQGNGVRSCNDTINATFDTFWYSEPIIARVVRSTQGHS